MWIHSVIESIGQLQQADPDQRMTARVWAAELHALTERWVPGAPALMVDYVASEGDIQIGWLNQREGRALTLYIDAESRVSLQLGDKGRWQATDNPDHTQLKTAVQTFFAGWTPREQVTGG